ncbi:MAG TPA: hypothetical protein VKT29_05345, partial [Terriglobales bacterium]|nr:hypothetical protein [Terriglobales bacterium]
LENLEAHFFLPEAVGHLQRVLEIRPEAIAYDLHPDYFSTQWALSQKGLPLIGVQHHHAHIASCMAENHLEGDVIGIALDGTGYGTDGCVWGGELLIASYQRFGRAAHLEYVPLPGAEAAIREPWRMAVSYLHHHFGAEFLNLDIPFVQGLDKEKVRVMLRAMERNINSPLTSSCGRLFDAVAALAGIRQQVNYEAQAAIELEMVMDHANHEPGYEVGIVQENGKLILRTAPLFRELVSDLERAVPAATISGRFHRGLVRCLKDAVELLRQRTSLNRVCLSGGTFNNRFLLEHLSIELRSSGFQVFTHSEVPAGDGGLSLGQAMVAASRLTPTGDARAQDLEPCQ